MNDNLKKLLDIFLSFDNLIYLCQFFMAYVLQFSHCYNANHAAYSQINDLDKIKTYGENEAVAMLENI